MATVSMRIDEALVNEARAAAKAEFRTVQGQVEFWAKVGRAAGPVEADANADDTGEGWLTAGDQPPPKARIALMLGLASGLGGEALRAVLLACDAARSIRPAPA